MADETPNTPASDAKTDESKKLSLKDQLLEAVGKKKELTEKVSTLEATEVSLKAKIEDLEGKLATAQGNENRLSEENEGLQKQVTALTESQKDFDQRLSDRVTETLAEQGVELKELPEAKKEGALETADELLKRMSEEKDPAKKMEMLELYESKFEKS